LRYGAKQGADHVDTGTPITVAAAGYPSLDRAFQDQEVLWCARHEGTFHHSALAVLAQRADGSFRIIRELNSAHSVVWGDALLVAGLFVLLPRFGARMLTLAKPDGRSAFVRHFHQHIGLDDLVSAAGLLEGSRFGLAAVLVNRTSTQVASQLGNADRASAMDMTWDDLEEGLRADLTAPFTEPDLPIAM
jgi:hypothetical protein